MTEKLHSGHKRILFLLNRDKGPDGWTKISKQVFPFIVNHIPPELVDLDDEKKCGRLTKKGQSIVYAMEWL